MSEPRRPDARHRADDPVAAASGVFGARHPDDRLVTADLSYHELRDGLWLSGKPRPRENERETARPDESVEPTETTHDPAEAESVEEETDRPEEEPEPDLVSRFGFSPLAARTDALRLAWPTLLALP